MEVAILLNTKPTEKIYGLTGNINVTTNNDNYRIITEYRFPGTTETFLNSPKSLASLKMVFLDESYLTKKSEDLSESEIKRIMLARALIENKDYIILDYFEKGLNYKEKENFKRLFRKLSQEYHKTILILTNDITFLWNIADEIIHVNKNGVINNYSKEEYFNLSNIANKPEITKFINMMRERNIKIADYKNVLDLLKAIYRLKGE